MIGVNKPISARPHRVLLDEPGATIPDGDGGWTQGWDPLDPPALWAAVEQATKYTLERLASGAVLSTATHIVTLPFHPGVTTQTRVRWTDPRLRDHVANVVGVIDHDGRCAELVLGVVEVVS